MHDPIVEEVRAAREGYAAKFNHDLDAICADLRRQQALSGSTVCSFPKRVPQVSVPAVLAPPTKK